MKIMKVFLFLAVAFFASPKTNAQISIGISLSARIAPPPLPVYTQPFCPGDGYIWTPGYWAYDDADGYYWVPGVWVRPPHYGVLWTPAYWGFEGGVYGFHAGYWGPHVGFYGGVNYGFGYGGSGFGGGEWRGNSFRYNTAVTNVNTTIVHNTYINRTVINNTAINNRTSFNGPGGVTARPSNQEQMAMHEQHINPTTEQMHHQQTAGHDRNQFAAVNHGRPTTVAMNAVGGKRFNATGKPATSALSQQQHSMPGQNTLATHNNAGRPLNGQPHQTHQAPAGQPQHQQHQQMATHQQQKPHPQQRPQEKPSEGGHQQHYQ